MNYSDQRDEGTQAEYYRYGGFTLLLVEPTKYSAGKTFLSAPWRRENVFEETQSQSKHTFCIFCMFEIIKQPM